MVKISCSTLYINNSEELYREFKVANNKTKKYKKVKEKEKVKKLF